MHCAALLVAISAITTTATAQVADIGVTAKSAVGRVGQRQARGEAAPNIEPMGRVENRIQNRVQSRLRNRIDRYYDPQANAASPFVVAKDSIKRRR